MMTFTIPQVSEDYIVPLSEGNRTNISVVDGKLKLEPFIQSPYDEKILINMTSNTLPIPYIASSSSIRSSTYPAWKAFNGTSNNSDDAFSLNSVSGWLSIDLGSRKKITSYSIMPRIGDLNSSPRSWTFEGYNDSNWVILDERIGFDGWEDRNSFRFVFYNDLKYRSYRLNIVENNGDSLYTALSKLDFHEMFDNAVYPPSGVYETRVIDLGVNFKNLTGLNLDYLSPSKNSENTDRVTFIPNMDGYIQSGYTITASHSSSSYQPYNIFNSNSNYWYYSGALPDIYGHWTKIDLGSNKSISEIRLTSQVISGSLYGVKDFDFYGSNNNVDWDHLTGGTHPNTGDKKSYILDATYKYRYFRINIKSSYYSPSNNISLKYLELIEAPLTMTVYTSTSNDKDNMSAYIELGENGEIMSEDGRFIKIKIEMDSSSGLNTLDFLRLSEPIYEANEEVFIDSSIRLKNSKVKNFAFVSDLGDGNIVLSTTLNKNDYKKINSMVVT